MVNPEFIEATELTQLGDRVKQFTTTKVRREVIQQYAFNKGGQVYTAIHSETNYQKIKGYLLGWNYVNRTGDYIVVLPEVVNR
jgi:sporulation protein YlmC with PRC-barrel domain